MPENAVQMPNSSKTPELCFKAQWGAPIQTPHRLLSVPYIKTRKFASPASYFNDSSSKLISPREIECPTPLGDSETEPVVPESTALHDDNLGAICFGQTSIFRSSLLDQLTTCQEAWSSSTA